MPVQARKESSCGDQNRDYLDLVTESSPWQLWNPNHSRTAALAAIGVTAGWKMVAKFPIKTWTAKIGSSLVGDHEASK